MENYNYKRSSSTLGQTAIFMVGLMAGQLTNDQPTDHSIFSMFIPVSYSREENFCSYSELVNPLTASYKEINQLDQEQVICNFYKDLLAKQEYLGGKFEEVLHENLWDLYEA